MDLINALMDRARTEPGVYTNSEMTVTVGNYGAFISHGESTTYFFKADDSMFIANDMNIPKEDFMQLVSKAVELVKERPIPCDTDSVDMHCMNFFQVVQSQESKLSSSDE